MKSLDERVSEIKARHDADAKRYAEHDGDLCMLCGAYGPDMRSLMVRCFYEIQEVLPEAISMKAVDPDLSSLAGSDFYYVRICKGCRGSFLGKLGEWRSERIGLLGLPKDSDGSIEYADPERNIPVRVNGTVQMLTLDEWEARQSR